jgi:hypothetical protein
MWRFKDRRLINFWVDYFKAYLKDFDFKKTKLKKMWLSSNSNFSFIDDETFIEYQPNFIKNFGFCYVIKDKKTQVNLAFLCLSNWEKNWYITRNSFFEVSWQGLELRNVEYFLDLLEYLWFEIEKFVRVDLAFDLVESVDYIYRRVLFDKLQNKTKTIFEEWWVVETIYIWKKNKSENTYQLLRIYNKKLDNKKKGKEWLYNYDDYDNVARFEIEIRRDKAKFWTRDKLTDVNYLFSVIVNTWYPFNYQYFKFLHDEDFRKVYESKSLYYSRLKSISERKDLFDKYWKDFLDKEEENKIVKIFVSYWKRLYKNWYSIEKLTEILKNHIDF